MVLTEWAYRGHSPDLNQIKKDLIYKNPLLKTASWRKRKLWKHQTSPRRRRKCSKNCWSHTVRANSLTTKKWWFKGKKIYSARLRSGISLKSRNKIKITLKFSKLRAMKQNTTTSLRLKQSVWSLKTPIICNANQKRATERNSQTLEPKAESWIMLTTLATRWQVVRRLMIEAFSNKRMSIRTNRRGKACLQGLMNVISRGLPLTSETNKHPITLLSLTLLVRCQRWIKRGKRTKSWTNRTKTLTGAQNPRAPLIITTPCLARLRLITHSFWRGE